MALLASVIIWYLPKDLGPSLTALAGLPHSAKDMRQRYHPPAFDDTRDSLHGGGLYVMAPTPSLLARGV